MEQFFGDMGFPGTEQRAYGAVLRHAKRACFRWIPGALKCFKGVGGPHRTPALMAGFNAVPCASAARRPAGSLLAWNNLFGDIGFPDAERAYGAVLRHLPWPVLRHLPWPVLRHAERNFFVRLHWLFDTPAPQPVATLKGAGEPHRTPALFAGIDAVPCASAPRPPGVETPGTLCLANATAPRTPESRGQRVVVAAGCQLSVSLQSRSAVANSPSRSATMARAASDSRHQWRAQARWAYARASTIWSLRSARSACRA